MSQRSGTEDVVAGEGRSAAPGGLDGLLGPAPTFTGALRGYDRMQVDNYVAWAEEEIALARRESEHLLSRYAACSGDLQGARRRLTQMARDRTAAERRSEQVLARAAAEAQAIIAAALEEAERIGAEARVEAQARLDKVDAIRSTAVTERDIARIEARGLRAEAAAVLAAARNQAVMPRTGPVEDGLYSVAGSPPPDLVVVPHDRHPVAS
jgi:colicin import membrane protein